MRSRVCKSDCEKRIQGKVLTQRKSMAENRKRSKESLQRPPRSSWKPFQSGQIRRGRFQRIFRKGAGGRTLRPLAPFSVSPVGPDAVAFFPGVPHPCTVFGAVSVPSGYAACAGVWGVCFVPFPQKSPMPAMVRAMPAPLRVYKGVRQASPARRKIPRCHRESSPAR